LSDGPSSQKDLPTVVPVENAAEKSTNRFAFDDGGRLEKI
jgi:hypothetical protein